MKYWLVLDLVEESVIYWIGTVIFAIASLVFGMLEKRSNDRELIFRSHFFVGFITTISYMVMALTLATSVAENGQPIYWTRWLFYIASCSILTLDIALIARRPTPKKVEVALLTGLTMFCGFLASVIVTVDRWWFFGLSSIAYIGMLYTLFNVSEGSARISAIMWFVIITWSLFPVVWVLAPTGLGIFPTSMEAILYLILDFVTKITFGLYVSTRFHPL